MTDNKTSKDVNVGSKQADEKPAKPVRDADALITDIFRDRPELKTTNPWHNGIDITIKNKDKVVKIYAAYSGKVVYIGDPNGSNSEKGYGYRIIVEGDNGYHHVYGHLKDKSAVVETEGRVKAGETELAEMGYTGFCWPPKSIGGKHLHFGMSKIVKGYGRSGIIKETEDVRYDPIDVQNLYTNFSEKALEYLKIKEGLNKIK